MNIINHFYFENIQELNMDKPIKYEKNGQVMPINTVLEEIFIQSPIGS